MTGTATSAVRGIDLSVVLLAVGAPGERWALLGASVAFVAVGVAALPWRSCAEVTPTVSDPPRPGQGTSFSCGGMHPAAWFMLATVTAAAASVDALGARRRSATGDPADGGDWRGRPERAGRR